METLEIKDNQSNQDPNGIRLYIEGDQSKAKDEAAQRVAEEITNTSKLLEDQTSPLLTASAQSIMAAAFPQLEAELQSQIATIRRAETPAAMLTRERYDKLISTLNDTLQRFNHMTMTFDDHPKAETALHNFREEVLRTIHFILAALGSCRIIYANEAYDEVAPKQSPQPTQPTQPTQPKSPTKKKATTLKRRVTV